MKRALWIRTDGNITEVSSRGDTFSLDELQKFVGGYIQLVSTRKPARDLYCNEEGLIHDLPLNRTAQQFVDPMWNTAGCLRGNVAVMMHANDTRESLLAAWGQR